MDRCAALAAGCCLLGQGVDPFVQAACLAGHQLWVAEGVGEQRDPLVGGHELFCQFGGVATAQEPELILCPLDWEREQLPAAAVQVIVTFVELRAEMPKGQP